MYDFEDYGEQIREVDRALQRERECVMQRAGWLNGLGGMVKTMRDVVRENDELREKMEELKQENEELLRRLEELCKSSTPMAFYNYGTYNEVLRK